MSDRFEQARDLTVKAIELCNAQREQEAVEAIESALITAEGDGILLERGRYPAACPNCKGRERAGT